MSHSGLKLSEKEIWWQPWSVWSSMSLSRRRRLAEDNYLMKQWTFLMTFSTDKAHKGWFGSWALLVHKFRVLQNIFLPLAENMLKYVMWSQMWQGWETATGLLSFRMSEASLWHVVLESMSRVLLANAHASSRITYQNHVIVTGLSK